MDYTETNIFLLFYFLYSLQYIYDGQIFVKYENENYINIYIYY